MRFSELIRARVAWSGLAFGTGYGLLARFAFDGGALGRVFGAMTLSFLIAVPFVMGYLTIRPSPNGSIAYQIFAPWVPVLLSVAAAWIVGWEGAICIVMGLPILLVMASLGGLLAGLMARRSSALTTGALVLLPWILAPLEGLAPAGDSVRTVTTSIDISAPPEVVWRNIVEVPTIRQEETGPALFTAMGFPRPLSATLTGSGIGGIRYARFERGVLFVETITEWGEPRRLAFRIAAQTDSIPPTTLDPHVTIGGRYFDALSGRYEILPHGDGVRLLLTSSHRLSTHFNGYSGLWSDAVMRSIQRNILGVIRRRCEREAGAELRQ